MLPAIELIYRRQNKMAYFENWLKKFEVSFYWTLKSHQDHSCEIISLSYVVVYYLDIYYSFLIGGNAPAIELIYRRQNKMAYLKLIWKSSKSVLWTLQSYQDQFLWDISLSYVVVYYLDIYYSFLIGGKLLL